MFLENAQLANEADCLFALSCLFYSTKEEKDCSRATRKTVRFCFCFFPKLTGAKLHRAIFREDRKHGCLYWGLVHSWRSHRGDRRYTCLYDAPVTCETQALLHQGSLLWFVVSPSRSSSANLEGILAPHMESDGTSLSPPTLRMQASQVTASPVGRLSSEASSAGPARCPRSCFIALHLSILLCEAPVSWGFLED